MRRVGKRAHSRISLHFDTVCDTQNACNTVTDSLSQHFRLTSRESVAVRLACERHHRKLVTRYSAIVQTTRLSCQRRQAVCLKIVFRDRKPELSHQQVPSELERICFDAALKLLAPMSFARSFVRACDAVVTEHPAFKKVT